MTRKSLAMVQIADRTLEAREFPLPTIGADDSVILSISPNISTVDDIQEGTGLPTLGIRHLTLPDGKSNTVRTP